MNKEFIKRNRMRLLLNMVIGLVMCMFLMPMTAFADGTSTQYDIWVSGVQVTDDNVNDVLQDGTVSFSFDATTNTGTLSVDRVDPLVGMLVSDGSNITASIYAKGMDLTVVAPHGIQLVSNDYGIRVEEKDQVGGNLFLNGRVQGVCTNSSLWAYNSVYVNGLVALNGRSGGTNYPIWSNGDITIDGSASVSVKGKQIYCIRSSGGAITITGDVDVDNQHVDGSNRGEGVYASKTLTIGGNVTAVTASDALESTDENVEVAGNVTITYVGDGYNYPIYAEEEVIIGGDVTISMEKGTSYAIWCQNGVTIGGDVDITNNKGYGIYVKDASGKPYGIAIDGNVKGSCTDSTLWSSENIHVSGDVDLVGLDGGSNYPIWSGGDITIDGNAKVLVQGKQRYCIRSDGAITITGDVDVDNQYVDGGQGVYASSKTLTIGGNVTAVTASDALEAGENVEVAGNVTITYVGDGYNYPITAEEVIIDGDVTISMEKGTFSAIWCQNGVTIGGNVIIKNNYPTGNGIYSKKGFIDITAGKFWDVEANNAALFAQEIVVGQGNIMTTPKDGVIGNYVNNGVDGKTVYEADGKTVAKHVVFNACRNGNHIFNDEGKCEVCGLYQDNIGAKLAGYSLSLSDNIGVNFYMELDDSVINDQNAKFLMQLPDGTYKEVPVSDAKKTYVAGKTYYVFDCYVAAKEMTDTIQATIQLGNGKRGTLYEFTVQDYAKYILDHPSQYENEMPVVKALLNYGTSAQKYFNYNTGKMANSILSDADMVVSSATPNLSAYNFSSPASTDKISYVGTSLLLKSEVGFKCYFDSSTTLTTSNISVKCGDKTIDASRIQIGKEGNLQYIVVNGVLPSEYGQKFTVSALNMTVNNVSVYGYMAKAFTGTGYSKELIEVLNNLYTYGKASSEYLK